MHRLSKIHNFCDKADAEFKTHFSLTVCFSVHCTIFAKI